MARQVWERYEVQMYNFDRAGQGRDLLWEEIERMGTGKASIDKLRDSKSERAEKIISAMLGNRHGYEEALNLPNQGHISNLPEGAIVEVPAVISAHGAHGLAVGPLPEPIAELCRRQITLAELVVDAAVKGDRNLALQALALDPMIDDPQVARNLLHDYLDTFRDYLPQFGEG
jgi:alpha-galactosidase